MEHLNSDTFNGKTDCVNVLHNIQNISCVKETWMLNKNSMNKKCYKDKNAYCMVIEFFKFCNFGLFV